MVEFWGNERVVFSGDDAWRVHAWPSLNEITRGAGRVAPEPGGGRLAVWDSDQVHLHEGGPVPLPDEVDEVGAVRWDESGGLVLTAGRPAMPPPRLAGLPLVPAPESGATALPWGTYPEQGMTLWRLSPDGSGARRLAAFSGIERVDDPQPVAGGVVLDWYRYQVFRLVGTHRILWVPPGGQPTDPFEDLPGSTFAGAPSPDGQRLAFLWDEDEPLFPFWNRLVVASGSQLSFPLPEEMRLGGRPSWSPDGGTVAVPVFEGIRTGVVAVDVATEEWRWLIPPDGGVESFGVALGGREAVSVWRSATTPTGLVRWDSGGRNPLAGWEGDGVSQPQELVQWSADGAELEGLLTLPSGQPEGPWPVVVDLHAGPVNGLDLFETGTAVPWRHWCEAGYAVFAPDFRSSGIAGRQAMHAALRADVDDPSGGSDITDVLQGVQALLEREIADPDRLFVFGFSYGGGLVNRLLARDNPFRAAVCYEGEADRRLTYSVAGGGSPLIRELMGGTPWEVPENYDAASAVTGASRVDTPLLLLYGEQRATEALCWYTALRDHGAPAELVIYRDEGHVNQRPENRQDLSRRCLDWFKRHAG